MWFGGVVEGCSGVVWCGWVGFGVVWLDGGVVWYGMLFCCYGMWIAEVPWGIVQCFAV